MTGHCLTCNHRGPRCWGCRHFADRLDNPAVALKEASNGFKAIVSTHSVRFAKTQEQIQKERAKARARWYGRV